MEWWIGGIAALVVGYLIINGRRNSDPMNRKCAAEICSYVTSTISPDPCDIRDILMRNARYRSQANHVISMVPPILIKAGWPRDIAMGFSPVLRAATTLVPR